jgi:type I restriction enzyme S subunit
MLFKLDEWLRREFLFPKRQEQQRITDCLSSIDELISAQGEKIDANRAH